MTALKVVRGAEQPQLPNTIRDSVLACMVLDAVERRGYVLQKIERRR
jgi:hypothetical protein